MEAVGRSGSLDGWELLEWREALRLYADVSDGERGPKVERERLEEELRRLAVRARRVEDGLVDSMKRGKGADDAVVFSRVFSAVARRVLDDCVAAEGKKI